MHVTIAAILEVGPDDVFLREAENAKSASTHCGVYGDSRVSHQLGAFIKSYPADNTARGVSMKSNPGKVPTVRPRGPTSYTHLCLYSVLGSIFRWPGLCCSCSPLLTRLEVPEDRDRLCVPVCVCMSGGVFLPNFCLSQGLTWCWAHYQTWVKNQTKPKLMSWVRKFCVFIVM